MNQTSSKQPNDNSQSGSSATTLDPAVAARRYLALLAKLSMDFASPEGKTSRVVNASGEVLEESYEADELFIKRLLGRANLLDDASSTTRTMSDLRNLYYDQALSLKIADSILEAEQARRDAERLLTDATKQVERASKALAEYEASTSSQPFWLRILRRHQTLQQRNLLAAELSKAQAARNQASKELESAQHFLNAYLESAYSADYYCCHHMLSPEHISNQARRAKTDQKYSKQFFCTANQPKIDLALELRQMFNLY